MLENNNYNFIRRQSQCSLCLTMQVLTCFGLKKNSRANGQLYIFVFIIIFNNENECLNMTIKTPCYALLHT